MVPPQQNSSQLQKESQVGGGEGVQTYESSPGSTYDLAEKN